VVELNREALAASERAPNAAMIENAATSSSGSWTTSAAGAMP